ncbi:MAG: hypothetical protein QM763_14570 [Agriterribacter sp.]
MKQYLIKSIVIATTIITLAACKKNDDGGGSQQNDLDKFVITTNITSSNPVIGYVGTFKDVNITSYTNAKARQFTQYPFVELYKDYVFVLPNKGSDVVKKFKRQPDGTLSDEGSITMPAGSVTVDMVVESDTKAYISLWTAGKIAVINPSTMQLINYIDLTSYALGGDGSPDPTNLLLKDNKLYVACVQTTDGYTSQHPAQILIIDLANGNAITSTTDSRTTWAGSVDDQHSMFLDENGDLYIFCVASYGLGGPSQKCGYLRIKSGQSQFDPSYFFNVADYNIADITGNKVDYLQHMSYAGSGIIYSTGNIYALASNPPDYINDRVLGSFKVDLINKTITKLNLPYSNSYAGCVMAYQNKVYWGLATATGVGIYSYDPATNTAGANPVITTQGDPGSINAFQ